jgi:hypothetical protein
MRHRCFVMFVWTHLPFWPFLLLVAGKPPGQFALQSIVLTFTWAESTSGTDRANQKKDRAAKRKVEGRGDEEEGAAEKKSIRSIELTEKQN